MVRIKTDCKLKKIGHFLASSSLDLVVLRVFAQGTEKVPRFNFNTVFNSPLSSKLYLETMTSKSVLLKLN